MSNRATLNSYILINYQRLEEALAELAEFVCLNLIQVNIYQLPVNNLGDESEVPTQIEILSQFTEVNDQSKTFVKKAITQNKINPFNENTYLAKRYPGIIVLPQNLKQQFTDLNEQANRLRVIFSDSVKVGFDKRQDIHENLHKLLPNVVLLSAVRQIKILDGSFEHVSSVNFYWRAKKIKKHVKHDDALNILDSGLKARNFECFGLTKDEVVNRHGKETELLTHVPTSSKIFEIRFARVQPFIDIWCKGSGETRAKRHISSNATIPIVLFKKPEKINDLKDYVYREPPKIEHPVLIQRKHWYLI
ncbi:DNA replication terminus site-binding protein [Shewanella sp. UCD-KL12]|uniref:DNA replication terminus site-binding protein n=1 Tax=Shewanella sp. UCD-KL12 TaxID=1917163 RepID=UPI000970CBAB|nr:DNA replication terminus site-binding protein [Shewanella sp. UCD-KL12]